MLNENLRGSVVKWISHSTSDAKFRVRILADPPYINEE